MVIFEDSSNPARADSSNGHIKDALDHRSSFFVQNPVIFVLRVRAVAVGRFAQVFAADPFGFYDRTNLFTRIFGIKIVKNIPDHGEIVISRGAVNRVIHGYETHIVAWKNDFCV
ncbi:hypothetical protein AALC17_06980 [Oscillospiraceae bacterium 38-13]